MTWVYNTSSIVSYCRIGVRIGARIGVRIGVRIGFRNVGLQAIAHNIETDSLLCLRATFVDQ